jgi:predicted metal-dependent phosphotriesterase family hydrolase
MKIRTVCGDIAPSVLGFTTMHEHTITDLTQLIEAQQM